MAKNKNVIIKNRNKANPRHIFVDILVYILLIALVLIWTFPLVWMVTNAFRANGPDGAPAVGSYFTTIFPEYWTTANFTEMFEARQQDVFDITQMFTNTLFVAIFSMIIGTSLVVAVSFVMSRRRFKSKNALVQGSMLLGLFPGFMSMIAIYQMLKAFGLLEGRMVIVGLILTYSAGAGSGFLLLRGYMDSIPYDLDEAAIIDGATQWQIFTKIIIPLSKPMIVYQVLTSFLGPWLDFMTSNIIIGPYSDYWTLPIGLYKMISEYQINTWYANFLAASVLIIIPIGTLTIIMQRFYNQSIGGAIKG